MTRWEFTKECVKRNWHGPLGTAERFELVFALAVGMTSTIWTHIHWILPFLAWSVPLTVFVATFLIGWTRSAHSIYVDEQTRHQKDESRLQEKIAELEAARDSARRLELRDQTRLALAELLNEGGLLSRQMVSSDAEYDEWKSKVESWVHRLIQYVGDHVGKTDAILVSDRTGIAAAAYQHAYRDPEHSHMICGVVRLCENTKELIGRLSGT